MLARAHQSAVYLQHTLDHLVVYVRRDVVAELFSRRLGPPFTHF